MRHFDKFLKNNAGFTLIELLAAILISSFVLGLIYSLLNTGYKSYQKIAIEGALRDEADYVISRIMQTFYSTEISDIKNCEPVTSPNLCIEIHSTETSKISTGGDYGVSITSLDEIKVSGSTITQIKINASDVIFDKYEAIEEDNRIKIDETTRTTEKINNDEFEFVTGGLANSSKIEATCSYSSAIVTNSSGEKFINKKCNNGIVDINLIIKKKGVDDESLQLELNNQFGF